VLKKTPLNEVHRELGGRMVEFGGWEMPVQYRGVIEEHLAVRGAAGLFDVSHMGEIEIRGPGALEFVQQVTVNNASKLKKGQVQYSAMCYPHGGVVDDLTVYRFDEDHFLLCVNASNTDKVFAWLEEVFEEDGSADLTLRNVSDEYAQFALQGPASETILSRLTDLELGRIPSFHFYEALVAETPVIVSRTGYTGEDGFELYFAPADAEKVWNMLMDAGSEDGLIPAGLGARDTLRLEMGYPLYGHELSRDISPLEAGLGWITRLEEKDFIGRDALLRQKQEGLKQQLIGLTLTEAGVPRAGYAIYSGKIKIGEVTSGTMSPSLRVGIAMALIDPEHGAVGSPLQVQIRNRMAGALVVKPPFFRR